MTQEKERIFIADLCARLPYGVQVFIDGDNEPYALLSIHPNKDIATIGLNMDGVYATRKVNIGTIKPYLRPMSSMTEKEQSEFVEFHCVNLCPIIVSEMLTILQESKMLDWLNSHHFDIHCWIDEGMAYKAPKGIYDIK